MDAGEAFKFHMEKDEKAEYLFHIFTAFGYNLIVQGIVKNICPCCIEAFCGYHAAQISDQFNVSIGVSYIMRTSEYERFFKEFERLLTKSNVDFARFDVFMINYHTNPNSFIGLIYQ